MRTVKRIIKIHEIEGFTITALFNNGESRVINFETLLKHWNVKKGAVEFALTFEENFKQVKLIDGTLVWENVIINSTDEDGAMVSYPFDIDPITLYENSIMDETRKIDIGLMIKQSRKEQGLTQEELAVRSGTSKHYISRIENNKTGIELLTLVKIVEGGLGKRIQISIL
ncbi:MAG: helix-turn-helix domain-containing protein [Aureispira sp.]